MSDEKKPTVNQVSTELAVGMVERMLFEERDMRPDVGVMFEAEWAGRQRVAEEIVNDKKRYLCRVILVAGLVCMLFVLVGEQNQHRSL